MQMLTLNGNGAHVHESKAQPAVVALKVAFADRARAGPVRARARHEAAAGAGVCGDRLEPPRRCGRCHRPRPCAGARRIAEVAADLAALALRDGHIDEAVRLARQALVLSPEHGIARFTLAMGLVAARRDDDALAALRALGAGGPAADWRQAHPALAQIVDVELARRAGAGGVPQATDLGAAQRLPLAARFDLLVKLLYVLHRTGQLPAWVTVDVPALYARHIQLRTGGVEPGDPQRKPNLDAYRTQFDALIDGMAANGFDTTRPVRLSRADGLPCDGAHRMATAMALGVPAAMIGSTRPAGAGT